MPSKEQFKVKVERNLAMKTRDGLTLLADVYRPDSDGRFPVLSVANALFQNRREPGYRAAILSIPRLRDRGSGHARQTCFRRGVLSVY